MNIKNKRWINVRKIILTLSAVFLLVMPVLTSYAAEAKILSTIVYEDEIYIYVRGISALQEGTTIQIGNTICSNEQIAVASFHDMSAPVRTLVLVDNSKSISENNHQNIQTILNGIISGSREDSLFRIGTFSDQIIYLCDYTSDRDTLTEAAGSIVYNDQDTYLSDVLYTVISQLKEENTSICTRILILSDGADDKSIGYTNDEVRSYIGENAYPVYTVGIPGKNNSSELETMFSFSRASSSEYFLLDGSISDEDIINTLLQDQEGICFKVTLDEELKDGSNKNILLKLGTEDGVVELKTNADMPFGDGSGAKAEQEEKAEPEEKEEEPEDVLPTLQVSKEASEVPVKEEKFPWIPVLLGCIVILLLALFAILMVMKKRKKNTEEVRTHDVSGQQTDYHSENDRPTEITEETELEGDPEEKDDAKPLWREPPMQYYLVLKNLDDSRIMFKVPITDVIHIGRGSASDIVLDDSKVSRKHCEIILRGDLLYIKDCDSKNKTYYEGAQVYGEMPIVSGGRIKAGKYQYRVELVKE